MTEKRKRENDTEQNLGDSFPSGQASCFGAGAVKTLTYSMEQMPS